MIIFGIFPNLLSSSIIEPAVAGIQPSLVGPDFQVHIAFWHGFQPELWMTVGIIAFGIILYKTFPKWQKIHQWMPERLSLNALYDNGLRGLERSASSVMKFLMTGSIRTYLLSIFLFFILSLGFTLYWKDAFKLDTGNLAPIGLYEWVLAAITVIGSIAILFARSRLTSIIILGAVGYTISYFSFCCGHRI